MAGSAALRRVRLSSDLCEGGCLGRGAQALLPALREPRYLAGATMTGGFCVRVLLAVWLAAAAAEGLEQAALPAEESRVQPMTASNWTLVMEGEWMLKL